MKSKNDRLPRKLKKFYSTNLKQQGGIYIFRKRLGMFEDVKPRPKIAPPKNMFY